MLIFPTLTEKYEHLELIKVFKSKPFFFFCNYAVFSEYHYYSGIAFQHYLEKKFGGMFVSIILIWESKYLIYFMSRKKHLISVLIVSISCFLKFEIKYG